MDTLTAPAAYDAAHRSLSAVLEAVPAEAWGAPSPCEGWTARDVVRHLVDTQRELFARHGLDLGDAPDVDADPAGAWRAHSGRVRDVLADDAVPAIAYDGHFGPTTLGATLVDFYAFDMVVHRWDVAQAAGLDAGLTDEELDVRSVLVADRPGAAAVVRVVTDVLGRGPDEVAGGVTAWYDVEARDRRVELGLLPG